ncbi:hypothetical protein [Bacillus sp. REN16]|uniref:hypothetical protein n=1 Tax=Bacillus sp. REN16 TaxID=2887296 RepID=UPI001E54988B|nr:hypothetical protein [Bacillus sp. REN16]MCC3359028.1 hypothetical protein [Bacillus sp. REN16]
MKLFQVRKGQFVYYNNELHKVYGVNPVYKQSVHLIKLRDLTQHLTKAAEVERYKPKEHDSFIFNFKAYTLKLDQNAEEGDYILIHNPRPDSLDTYSLNEIEMVETVDKKGIITSNSHGVKHNEYMLMAPGRDKDSHPIDFKDMESSAVADLQESLSENANNNALLPSLGDIYQKKDSTENIIAMVIAIKGDTVYLGGDQEVSAFELMNADKWEFLYSVLDQDS